MAQGNAAEMDLSGLVDVHIHAAPDVVPRFGDDVEVARLAAAAGMRAIMLKSHVTLTADRASLAQKAVGGGLHVCGGLALNLAVGGLNPAAVEVALKLGAKEVWMPTRDAAQERRWQGKAGGITIFGEDGHILPVVHEILDLVRAGDVILGTGHLAGEETRALVRLARERGLRKIMVTHPEARFLRLPVALQQEMAGEGVFFERCFVATRPSSGGEVTVAEIAAQIRQVGVASTVLATDFGQAANPSPVEGMRAYLAALLAEGFTEHELRRMAGDNPADLLDLGA